MDWIKTILLAGGIVVAGFFVGNMHKTGMEYDRSVVVKGLSEREVPADLAVWPMQITLAGNDLKSLKAEIESQNRDVVEFFVGQGFEQSELTIGSTSINDAQADVYGGSTSREFRYIAKSELTVRTGNIEKLQKALAESLELLEEGILIGSKNTWRPIEYSFSGLNALKPEMIEEATKNAREVAEKFARDSNSSVGQIKSANQGLFTISDRDENTPYIKTVRVVTTIQYLLED